MNSEGFAFQFQAGYSGGGEGSSHHQSVHQTASNDSASLLGGAVGGYGQNTTTMYGVQQQQPVMEPSPAYLSQHQQGHEQQYYVTQQQHGGVSYPTLPEPQRSTAAGYYQSQSQQARSDELVNITYSDQQYQPVSSSGGSRSGNYNHNSRPSPTPSPYDSSSSASSQAAKGSGGSPRYKVTFKGEFGETQSVFCEIGMDGLKLIDSHNGHVLETFPLNIISRWAVRDKDTFLFWAAKDVSEGSSGKQRQVELKGSVRDVNDMLDTITAACMQLCEVIDKEEHQRKLMGLTNEDDSNDGEQCSSSSGAQQEKKGLVGWIAGKVKPGQSQSSGGDSSGADGNIEDAMTSIPEGVEYWKQPDYDGWMQSQGEHIKTWRKRWFVLKDGYLFRFMNDKVLPQTKPRGILNLALCLEISKASKDSNQGPTIEVSIQKKKGLSGKGSGVENILFVADSKAERDLWLEIMNRARKDVVQSKEKKEKEKTAAETRVVEPEHVDEALLKALEGYKKSAKSSQVTTSTTMPSAPCQPKPTHQQQQARPPPPVSDAGQTNWKVCYTPDGRAYYYNTVTGITQWEAPVF